MNKEALKTWYCCGFSSMKWAPLQKRGQQADNSDAWRRPQFHIQLVNKPHFLTLILLFGLFGQLRAVRKFFWVFLSYFWGTKVIKFEYKRKSSFINQLYIELGRRPLIGRRDDGTWIWVRGCQLGNTEAQHVFKFRYFLNLTCQLVEIVIIALLFKLYLAK